MTGQAAEAPGTGTLFIVSAPSGAGKTSLIRALVQSDAGVSVSVSHTTRAPRPGEVDGRDYHFVDQAEFRRMVEAGEFLEHARVFDHFYGTSKAEVASRLAAASDVLLEIDWQGSRQIRAVEPAAVAVFVLPPSLEALRRRLVARAQDDGAVIERRMRDALAEISHYGEYDFVIVNDDFEAALGDLRAIVRAHRLRADAQRVRHRPLIDSLERPA
jgi:guanylate kinase